VADLLALSTDSQDSGSGLGEVSEIIGLQEITCPYCVTR